VSCADVPHVGRRHLGDPVHQLCRRLGVAPSGANQLDHVRPSAQALLLVGGPSSQHHACQLHVHVLLCEPGWPVCLGTTH